MKLPRSKAPRNLAKINGFTLIELLVVVVIIGVLAALSLGAYSNALKRGAMVREMGAAKTLIAAYATYAADHDGILMPAYDMTAPSAQKPDGTTLAGPAIWRYPWRLAPYFAYKMKGTCLINGNLRNLSGADADYYVSCFPALGINGVFMGGTIDSSGAYSVSEGEVATRQVSARTLLVFASAAGKGSSPEASGGGGNPDGKVPGFCKLDPPATTAVVWRGSAWTRKSEASDYGNVDARYDGKAICAFLDGSVRLQTIEELRDMRLWSKNAAEENNPNYTIARSTPSRR